MTKYDAEGLTPQQRLLRAMIILNSVNNGRPVPDFDKVEAGWITEIDPGKSREESTQQLVDAAQSAGWTIEPNSEGDPSLVNNPPFPCRQRNCLSNVCMRWWACRSVPNLLGLMLALGVRHAAAHLKAASRTQSTSVRWNGRGHPCITVSMHTIFIGAEVSGPYGPSTGTITGASGKASVLALLTSKASVWSKLLFIFC